MHSMRITQWGEYGILISAYLAFKQHHEARLVIGAAEIAAAQEIALQYAQQILLRLRDGGIVKSVRGPHGGYSLAKPLEEISLLDVLVAAEGESLEVICSCRPLALDRCKEGHSCFLQDVWLGLKRSIDSYLESLSLAAVVRQLPPEAFGQLTGIEPHLVSKVD